MPHDHIDVCGFCDLGLEIHTGEYGLGHVEFWPEYMLCLNLRLILFKYWIELTMSQYDSASCCSLKASLSVLFTKGSSMVE